VRPTVGRFCLSDERTHARRKLSARGSRTCAKRLDQHRLRRGSLAVPFSFHDPELSGRGDIAAMPVHCEAPDFALANHTRYELRATD
jgi:hypothetical protein